MTTTRMLVPGDSILVHTWEPWRLRAISRNVRGSYFAEVKYAYPAGNAGKARTHIVFTDGVEAEYPTNAEWIVDNAE